MIIAKAFDFEASYILSAEIRVHNLDSINNWGIFNGPLI